MFGANRKRLGKLESMLTGLMPRFLSQLPDLRAEYLPIPLTLFRNIGLGSVQSIEERKARVMFNNGYNFCSKYGQLTSD